MVVADSLSWNLPKVVQGGVTVPVMEGIKNKVGA